MVGSYLVSLGVEGGGSSVFVALLLVLTLLANLATNCFSARKVARGKGFRTFSKGIFRGRISNDALALRCALTRPRGRNVQQGGTSLNAIPASVGGACRVYDRCRGGLGSFHCDRLSARGRLALSSVLLCCRARGSLNSGCLLRRPLNPDLNVRTRLPILLTRCTFCRSHSVASCLGLLAAVHPCFRDVLGFRGRGSRTNFFVDSAALSQVLRRYDSFVQGPSDDCVLGVFRGGLSRCKGLSIPRRGTLLLTRRGLVGARIVPTCRRLVANLRTLHNAKGGAHNLACFGKKGTCCLCLLRDRVNSCIPMGRVRGQLSKRLSSRVNVTKAVLQRGPRLLAALDQKVAFERVGPTRVLGTLRRGVRASFPPLASIAFRLHAIRSSVGRCLDPTFCLAPPVSAKAPGIVCVGPTTDCRNLRLFAALTRRKFPKRLCRAIAFRHRGSSGVQGLLYASNFTRK